MADAGSLENKVAVVTGSARGVGLAIALELAGKGCKVVVADRTDEAFALPGTVYTSVEAIEKMGGTALPVRVDVRSEEQIMELKRKTLEAFGTVDIIVNNAGITYDAKVWDLPTERWDLVMSVNVRGTFLICKHFLPVLIEKRGGSIINISSPSGRGPHPNRSVYSASKAAVDYFTLSLAEEVREYSIAVNCIAPSGGIDTEGNRHLFPDPAVWEQWEPREHFALAVSWLARQSADSFTGQLVYSRTLIARYGLCKNWCCAALGREPYIGGPLSVDWQSNLSCRPPSEEDQFH